MKTFRALFVCVVLFAVTGLAGLYPFRSIPRLQPGAMLGLAISLGGALLVWLSVLVISRLKR